MSNTRVGNPIVSCPAGNGPHQENNSDHADCAIEITSIVENFESEDSDEDDYKGGETEIFVKNLNNPISINYETKACSMQVTIWIEYDLNNSIHSNFYSSYEGNGVTGNKLVILLEGECKAPGQHQVLWDGRDTTEDHRILLEGTYTIHIQGLHEVLVSDQTIIKIASAYSYNFGIHYHKREKLVTTKLEIEHANNKQRQLHDGTAFDSEAYVDSPAFDTWHQMGVSAVTVTATHSNPSNLFFYSQESMTRNRALYRRANSSHISMFSSNNYVEGKDITLSDEDSDALRDVFLIILAGCRSGNNLLGLQRRLNQISKYINPGRIDGFFGDKTRNALTTWQRLEKLEIQDGDPDRATCLALGIDTRLEGSNLTTAVQEKLKSFSRRYFSGSADGKWGPNTERAVTNYQEDHSPTLDVNSLPDRATLEHLGFGHEEDMDDLNMVDALLRRGCNIALGFKKSVRFKAAEMWHINFWNNLANGSGIENAAADAILMCTQRYRSDLEYTLKSRDGIDTNETLHPARYGKDMNV